MSGRFWIIFALMLFFVIWNFFFIANGVYPMPQGVGYPPGQQPQQQQGPLAKVMPGQAGIADQFANQSRPFGWLMDMIAHITGQGQPGQGQAPVNQPGPTGKPPKDKQSQDTGGMGGGGQIDPSQVPELASIMNPNAATNLGLMPQTQGSFGWLLQQLQNQQMQQQQAQGAGLVQLVSSLMGQAQPGLDLTSGQGAQSAAPAPKAAGKG